MSEILDLVKKFELNYDSYRDPAYNETQVRLEFINPLFEALGWDIANRQGYAEAYKEVIHEAVVKVGGATKAPDYAFRIGGTKKFFLEAKKPGVDIKNNPEPAYQLRRYAWSAGLPLSILTDFEEFAVYDCRIRPQKSDKASVGRILYLTYRDYESRWAEIANVFAKQAILQGSFDRYAEGTKGKRGTSPVDDAFLEEIEEWRSKLAHNIASRNRRLKVRDLNFAVQRTIDRIIFLRMCEDRGIELYGQLQALLNGTKVYDRLKQIYYLADDKYNSGLFHFEPEAGRAEQPDELTTELKIDDKTLKDIIWRLYYPESPYEFSVLSGDILGNVYEQFLGKVIHLTKTHQARIEEKLEVKKAGGVYYTPKYIVDYIVKNTVGKLCENKTPKQIEKLRILDPACGSGSFLIGAYSFLLDYHRDWYEKDGPERHTKEIFRGTGGQWYLATQKKKEILLNNIYGVDIDNQAVEVTKLNLLLKVLEGETKDTLQSQMKLWRHRALPDLGNNIKCGNSLIGPDYYHGKQLSLLDEEEKFRVNVFDWKTEFLGIMKQGGFDAVIGNPPYGATLSSQAKDYLGGKYPFVSDFETSQYFIVRSQEIAKRGGFLSFIVPNTMFLNLFAQKFRSYVLKHFIIDSIFNLAEIEVFKRAKVRTVIPFFIKSDNNNFKKVRFLMFENPTTFKLAAEIKQKDLEENDKTWLTSFSSPQGVVFRKRLVNITTPLGDILEVSQGLIPYDKYRGHDERTIKNRIWHSDRKKNKTYKRELQGGDVKRYFVSWNGKQWISYGPWLAAPRKPEFFTKPRLLFREITDPKSGLLHVAYSDEEFYNNPGIINCISRNTKYSLLYILGIANSRLLAYLHFSSSPKARKGMFPKILVNDVRNLPIRSIEFSDPKDKAGHDKMVLLVEQVLELHKQLNKAKTPDDKTRLQRQIDATDRQIDQLVYELYGLTEDEIRVVQGNKL